MSELASETRTWEEVLAAVEADAAHAAALLAGRPEDPLPAATPPVLPALADMPAVPEELKDRIESLRDRIASLQDELTVALREWQLPVRSAPVSVAAAHYLDRQL
jgi:hypothetical protein